MSDNYYDGTGVLVLDKVTPVIHALFSELKLDPDYPGDGKAYITISTSECDPLWENIITNLVGLANTLGLPPSTDIDDGGKAMIHALCLHFGDKNDALFITVMESSGNDSVWLGDLFNIAHGMDDGHGLRALEFEGCWHSNKLRLFEFGGEGVFISKDFNATVRSGEAFTFGEALQGALQANDLDKAAEHIAVEIDKLLDDIHDETKRKAVKKKLFVANEVVNHTLSAALKEIVRVAPYHIGHIADSALAAVSSLSNASPEVVSKNIDQVVVFASSGVTRSVAVRKMPEAAEACIVVDYDDLHDHADLSQASFEMTKLGVPLDEFNKTATYIW